MSFFELIGFPLHVSNLHLHIFEMDFVGDGGIVISDGSGIDHILWIFVAIDLIICGKQFLIDISIQFLK
jgi:hypothetical protein